MVQKHKDNSRVPKHYYCWRNTHTLSRMRKKILQSLGSMVMKDLARVISQNYRNYLLFSDSLYPFLVLCMSNDELIHFVLYV